jgi:YgiT-type zinc finger domain-containing protein
VKERSQQGESITDSSQRMNLRGIASARSAACTGRLAHLYQRQARQRIWAGQLLFSGIIEESDLIRMAILNITICPSCGSKKIKMVRRNWTGSFKGKEYTVPNLEYYECPACGEKVYTREAMRQIEDHSLAFKRSASKRKPSKTARASSLKS